MGGWTVVNQVGLLLFLNADLMVVNTFFGTEMAGRYGTVILFPTLISTLAHTASSVLNLVIVARYALQGFKGIHCLVF